MSNGSKKSKWLWVVVVVVVLAIVVGWLAWCALLREEPQEIAAGDEYFKYGSIGGEQATGIPYWIWLVLPNMFPEKLPKPDGWAAFGFNWEQGQPLPVGFSNRTVGFERVTINCAFCHTGRLRVDGDPVPKVILGGPGNTVDPLAYQRFLFAAAADPRFTGDNVVREIDAIYDMGFFERELYRWLLVPLTRDALLDLEADFTWTNERPAWGRGRIDPFNPVKVAILGDVDPEVGPGDTIGNSDMQTLWSTREQAENGWAYHWDGLQTDLHEVVVSSALGDGAIPKTLPEEKLAELQDYIQTLRPPKFTDYFEVDTALADAGRPIYQQHCARCHADDGELTGSVLPLTEEAWTEGIGTAAVADATDEADAAEGGAAAADDAAAEGDGEADAMADAASPAADPGDPWTDPHRAEMWDPAAAAAYNEFPMGDGTTFDHFRSTGGYVNVPLHGLWLRAPYLHNGSVPYLAELFEPPSERTKNFYRGYDLYDPERVGFVAEGEDAERGGTVYDVTETGNSNQGHLWGIELSEAEKQALVEYLKTL